MLTKNETEVLSVIREMPGLTAAEIVELVPNDHRSTTNMKLLTNLYKAGLVDRALGTFTNDRCRGRRPYVYTAATDPQPREIKVKPAKQKGPSSAGYEARIEALHKQLEDLNLWKDNAIKRFPDLAVPDVVIRARKLVADQLRGANDPHGIEETLAGRRDHTILVKSVVAALEQVV